MRPLNVVLSDGVTTLMYASGVNVILANSVGLSGLRFLLPVSFILFLTIDWLSRTRVPASFPDSDQVVRRSVLGQLSKGTLEIVCAYLLVWTALALLVPEHRAQGLLSGEAAFAIFLLASFIWNGVVLWVMQGASYRELLFSSVRGNAFDLDAAQVYTKKFVDMVDERAQRLCNQPAGQQQQRAIAEHAGGMLIVAFARSVSQLVAFHVAIANLLLGLVLLTDFDGFFIVGRALGEGAGAVGILSLIVLGGFAVSILLFYAYEHGKATGRNGGPARWAVLARSAAASLSLVVMLCFYSAFDSHSAMIVVALEHVGFGVFIQFAVPFPRNQVRPPGSVLNETSSEAARA